MLRRWRLIRWLFPRAARRRTRWLVVRSRDRCFVVSNQLHERSWVSGLACLHEDICRRECRSVNGSEIGRHDALGYHAQTPLFGRSVLQSLTHVPDGKIVPWECCQSFFANFLHAVPSLCEQRDEVRVYAVQVPASRECHERC